MVVDGEAGVVIVPAPLIKVHKPVPTNGVLAAILTDVAHTVWFGPAIAVVGPATVVIVT